jgi:hypothetical protein
VTHQSASDADRQVSADDQTASDADDMSATADQAASDRDQRLSDVQHDAAVRVTPADQKAYERDREDRRSASSDRRTSRLRREVTTRLRGATSALRDRIVRPRLRPASIAAAVKERLMDEGVPAELAQRWCDAWEVEAVRQGLPYDSGYWSLGTHWIWTERTTRHEPAG